jgi:hypothetical protein
MESRHFWVYGLILSCLPVLWVQGGRLLGKDGPKLAALPVGQDGVPTCGFPPAITETNVHYQYNARVVLSLKTCPLNISNS